MNILYIIYGYKLLGFALGGFFMMILLMKRREAMIQDEQNRNILSEAAMAVNWGNTSLNPRGGVSYFRFLQEEKEQSTLFYLCGPPAQLSFSLSVSAPLSPPAMPPSQFTDAACSLFR